MRREVIDAGMNHVMRLAQDGWRENGLSKGKVAAHLPNDVRHLQPAWVPQASCGGIGREDRHDPWISQMHP